MPIIYISFLMQWQQQSLYDNLFISYLAWKAKGSYFYCSELLLAILTINPPLLVYTYQGMFISAKMNQQKQKFYFSNTW